MNTKYQEFAVHYFLTRSIFLGIGFSLIIGITKQDSILAFILGTIIGLFFIFLINKIQQFKGEKTLDELLKEMKFLGVILRIIFLIFGIVLLTQGITFIQLFAASFFLSKSPLFFISLPIILLLLKIAQGGVKTTFRVAGCLFPISLILTVLSLAILMGYASFDNITPLLVSKPYNFLKATFYYTSLSACPAIFMLVTKDNNKNHFPSYLLGSATLIIKVYLIIAIVGPILASYYRFPEYLILKEIKLFDFIEKIESVVSISWVFDNFVFLALASLFIKSLLPKKANKISHGSIVIIAYFVSYLFLGKNYPTVIFMYYNIAIFIFAIFIITIPPLLIYTFRHRKKIKTSA